MPDYPQCQQNSSCITKGLCDRAQLKPQVSQPAIVNFSSIIVHGLRNWEADVWKPGLQGSSDVLWKCWGSVAHNVPGGKEPDLGNSTKEPGLPLYERNLVRLIRKQDGIK